MFPIIPTHDDDYPLSDLTGHFCPALAPTLIAYVRRRLRTLLHATPAASAATAAATSAGVSAHVASPTASSTRCTEGSAVVIARGQDQMRRSAARARAAVVNCSAVASSSRCIIAV